MRKRAMARVKKRHARRTQPGRFIGSPSIIQPPDSPHQLMAALDICLCPAPASAGRRHWGLDKTGTWRQARVSTRRSPMPQHPAAQPAIDLPIPGVDAADTNPLVAAGIARGIMRLFADLGYA